MVSGIRIQTLTEEYFDEAREIERAFALVVAHILGVRCHNKASHPCIEEMQTSVCDTV